MHKVLGGSRMQLLEERIRRDGKVAPGNVLRVDGFINHQMDMQLMAALAEEFYRLFADSGVDKVLTIEASGIAIAALVAQRFGVPMLFAKKSKTSNIPDSVYSAPARSFTHGTVNNVMVSREFLHESERVLLIDDFLAHGEALTALIDVVHQAGAVVAGAGILIEKAFQPGGDKIRATGVRVESLARVKAMDADTGSVEFL